MNKKMPIAAQFMTRSPKVVPHDMPLPQAERLMREMEVRHLPVVDNGRLVGLLSHRNVKAALMGPRGESYEAKDAMSPDPFVTAADTPLDVVVAAMASEKYGSVLLTDDSNNVVGIFTTVDACHALRQILQTSYE